MDVRDEALHVNKAVEPENQSLNVSRFYKKNLWMDVEQKCYTIKCGNFQEFKALEKAQHLPC